MKNDERRNDFDDFSDFDDFTRVSMIRMSEVQEQEVKWLWYPYIPSGKITIVEGDPGEGKTMFVLATAASLTNGKLPFGDKTEISPINVIYQTAEDGLADTVKPRLKALGADCDRISVIDESFEMLSLTDSRIKTAIEQESAKLLIIDPLQAYLGADIDMHRANEIRPLMRNIGDVAAETGCSVILIEHLNKQRGGKAIYRGLGSVDISAAARSILLVGRTSDDADVKAVAQIKNNLSPIGSVFGFRLEKGFQWVKEVDGTAEDIINNLSSDKAPKLNKAKEELLRLLTENGEMPQKDIIEYFKALGISARTVKEAKSTLNIKSRRNDNVWYWSI